MLIFRSNFFFLVSTMGGNWSYDTALDSTTADQHTRRMMSVFERLIKIYGQDSGTIHVYTWTKSFDIFKRPLDCHKVVDFTLDHRNFVTVEFCKRWIKREYTIYPDSRDIPLNDEQIGRLEYVGSKQFFDLSSAPAHFVDIAVQTMLDFGDYDHLVNNSQDYVDTYLDNIGLDRYYPNYYTDYGKIAKQFFYAGLVFCLILLWLAGEPSEIHQYSMPTVIRLINFVSKFILMLLATMVYIIARIAILKSIVRRNVRTGYELFSYCLTNSELISRVALIMICIMHMYNGNIISFYNWRLVLLSWVYIADTGYNVLRPMASIFRYVPMLQTIGMVVYEYFYGLMVLSWSYNPAIWILIAFPKELSTTGPTETIKHWACLCLLSISVALLYSYERMYEETSGKLENLGSMHVKLINLNTCVVFPLFCIKFVISHYY